jgi:lipoprotein-releasing system permease protein
MSARFVAFFSRRLLRGKGGTARYLRGAVIGIAISLVPLIVVLEVSSGMIDGITARLLEVGTYHLQVPVDPGLSTVRLERLSASIAGADGVTAAVAERQGTALLLSGSAAAGVTIRCVPPDVFQRDAGFHAYVSITAGTADLSAPNAILLSSALARTLGVGPGDTVSVLTTWAEDLAGPARLTAARVVGIYETGYQEMDAALVYAPLAFGDRVLSPRASRALIGVKVSDPFGDLTRVEENVAAAAGGDVRVASWREVEYARLASFATTKALLLFIMALVVVVASVNVSSSVLMIIIERREELGILGSFGAGPRSLSVSFLLAGCATGLAGTIAGIATGLLVAVNINAVISGLEGIANLGVSAVSLIERSLAPGTAALGRVTLFNSAYYLKEIPIRIQPVEISLVAVGTLIMSALASYVPAARSARMRPLSTLRKV